MKNAWRKWIRNLCKCSVSVNLLSPVNQLFKRNGLSYSTLCNIYCTVLRLPSGRRGERLVGDSLTSSWTSSGRLTEEKSPVQSGAVAVAERSLSLTVAPQCLQGTAADSNRFARAAPLMTIDYYWTVVGGPQLQLQLHCTFTYGAIGVDSVGDWTNEWLQTDRLEHTDKRTAEDTHMIHDTTTTLSGNLRAVLWARVSWSDIRPARHLTVSRPRRRPRLDAACTPQAQVASSRPETTVLYGFR